jgi:hypothetical protein
MIFSVYDPYRRAFDYYEAPGTSASYGERGTRYRPLAGRPQLSGHIPTAAGSERVVVGYLPEALVASLPQSARKVGSGSQARGIVAQPAGAELGQIEQPNAVPPPPPVAAAGGVSFGQVVAASVLATVVGVFVQRALRERK